MTTFDIFDCGLRLNPFDSDKDMEIQINDQYGFLNPKQVNDLITYCAEQLKSINEPINILTTKP